MNFKTKLFSILLLSQFLLVIAFSILFITLSDKIKNEPQNQRVQDLATNFEKELLFKDKILRNLVQEITANPKSMDYLKQGIQNRNLFYYHLNYFTEIMKRYDLNIFEIGDKNGIVLFRFHRPADYGDNKLSQKIIQSAIQGKVTSTIELGHSGLAFRMTSPIENKGTILIGQVIDDSFASKIVNSNLIHLAITESEQIKASSSSIINEFCNQSMNKITNGSRIKFKEIPFYISKIRYNTKDMTNLKLDFIVLIDESDIQSITITIWKHFFSILAFIFFGIFVISYIFSNNIIYAVKQLTKAMELFQLDQEYKIDIQRKDEIGTMGKIFLRMKSELKEYYLHLEDLVEQRTIELNKSLQEIQKLKESQDGDYFLTSLLIKPLSSISVNSSIVKVETLINQKKKFSFKNKPNEIGGDLCVADRIQLKNKNYTVILNGDAMGKSLQGAGGAIVLGTVFKSIIQNTLNIPSFKDKHPERWLKDCYNELNNVFISFDGTMLASAFIALICEDTGTLYFINLEHPFSVLYRDEVASFIDKEIYLYKIGVDIEQDPTKIQIIQLKDNDVVFLGSDGRDDIILKNATEEGINKDHHLILKYIERGKGNLKDIERIILQEAELTDDFSMMRISYNEDMVTAKKYKTEEFVYLKNKGLELYKKGSLHEAIELYKKALVLYPEDQELLRELAKLCLRTKNYKKAANICEKYVDKNPSDTNILYYTSYAHRKNKNYKEAADFGERVLLREPSNINNLINLAETYLSNGNIDRAMQVLDILNKLEPENERVKKVLAKEEFQLLY